METHEIKQIVESLLFVATEPLSSERIREVIGNDKKVIHDALKSLMDHYQSQEHGLQLVEVAEGFQLVTRPENSPWIKKFLTVKTTGRLSKPGLETLAIIAYKQPIIRTDIETIRGVDCGGVIKTLLERRMVRIVGRKEMPGKPMLYGTTREFLEYFGLKNLSDLPTLKEFKETCFSDAEPEFIPSSSGAPEPQGSYPEAEKTTEGPVSEAAAAEVPVLLNQGP